uniref:Uncharacterized protein n=1 Tax=Physcomitrium patens TaxID=3218 RepID=A0A2K1JHQ0_PHYPA|nr:hypothetical protein PHYPA_018477 [Physcomitrium patens]
MREHEEQQQQEEEHHQHHQRRELLPACGGRESPPREPLVCKLPALRLPPATIYSPCSPLTTSLPPSEPSSLSTG